MATNFASSSSNRLDESIAGRNSYAPIPRPAPVLDIPALENAGQVVVEQILKDCNDVPDLGDTLSLSGLPSTASYTVFPDDYRVPYQKRRLIGIPEGLFQYYNTTNVTSHMGLMPEIERVWVTIDHNLFLWDYVEGQELSSFMDQPDVISHVALVKPKPGVFIDEITSLLVICTPVSVLILGVSTSPATSPSGRVHKEIKLYATDMTIASEIEMTSVIGTHDGRIFMCGSQDGHLYELHYQEKEGWFGKRVQLINHSVGGVRSLLPRLSAQEAEDHIVSVVSDVSRKCFFTLTAKNSISVYKTNGDKTVQLLQTITNLCKAAQDKAPGSAALTPHNFQIISLHVIPEDETQSSVQLFAMTSYGVRLYFASIGGAFGYSYGSQGSGITHALRVVHVRLPPPNLLHPDEQTSRFRPVNGYGISSRSSQNPRPYIVTGLDSSCYQAGLTVAAQPGDTDGTDFIVCLSPDLTQIGNFGPIARPPVHQTPANLTPLTEQATLLAIPGRTWAMAAVPPSPMVTVKSASPSSSPFPSVINELAVQFSEPSRQFMILTNVGLTFLAKRRALDYLKDVLEEFQVEGNAQPLIQFRDSFGRNQTCAMLLAIASGNTFLEIGEQSTVGTISTVSPEIAAVAKQAFYDFGERPMWSERVTYGTSTSEGSGTATFSGRRQGFALYLARLIRPLWLAKVTKTGALGLQELNVSDDVLVIIQRNMSALKELLDTNPQLFHSAPGDHAGARAAAAGEQEAWRAEQRSVSELTMLLARAIEAISFVLLLNDHKLGELISQCEPAVQNAVKDLQFHGLITTQRGVDASRALVNVVINQQIGQQISVDTISEVLQQRCGSFCSTDDVMIYKARENVRKAVETRNPSDKQTYLGESLRLFIKGARILDLQKLREICGDYQQLNYAKGAVELPLFCAPLQDPDLQGQNYWYAGCPANDKREEFWKKRTQCYSLVLDSLFVFEERSLAKQQPATASATSDAETVKLHAYELAFASEDEMFHSTLYDWLIERNLADELLEMRPAYLEAHLRREPVTVQKYQLLWQFYVKDGQPLRAAEVLCALAESTNFDLSLESRVEYLTLAVGNAKSHPVSAGGKLETAIAFLSELEEKLEVAQVQLELLNLLLPHLNSPDEKGAQVKVLSTRLLTISELWYCYAKEFNLPTMQLLILHVSEHHDDNLVRPIWNQIVEDVLNGVEPKIGAERLVAKIVPLGQRFYPSESAFPLRHIAALLVRFGLANKDAVAYGWAPRILVQCGVPYPEIWDIFHEMYESHIPPFNDQANVQALSSDIAVLLTDWLDEVKRPQAAAARAEFPVFRIDQGVEQYLAELSPNRTETKIAYETIKRELRRYW